MIPECGCSSALAPDTRIQECLFARLGMSQSDLNRHEFAGFQPFKTGRALNFDPNSLAEGL